MIYLSAASDEYQTLIGWLNALWSDLDTDLLWSWLPVDIAAVLSGFLLLLVILGIKRLLFK